MRSKGFWSRMFSSFMSEPVTTASMAISTYDNFTRDMQKGMSRQEAWQKNKALIARTTTVYCISAILLAAVQSVIDANRDDDDEDWIVKYGQAFVGNVIDELLPFNKLPYMSEFYEFAKGILSKFGVDTYGNPTQTVVAQLYDTLTKSIEILYDKVSGEKTGYTPYASIYKLIQTVAGLTGIPAATATREVITVWNNTAGALNPNLKVRTYESSTTKQELAEYKFDKGDTASVKTTVKKMTDEKVKSGKTEKEAKSAVRSSFTSSYKPEYMEAFKNKDYEEMNRIRKFLHATGLYGTLSELDETLAKWRKAE